MSADSLELGVEATLIRIEDSSLHLRLLDLGIHPGMLLTRRRSTMMGNTSYLETPLGSLALRKEELADIIIAVK